MQVLSHFFMAQNSTPSHGAVKRTMSDDDDNLQPTKVSKTNSNTETDTNDFHSNNNFPRFLIMTAQNSQTLSNFSPWFIKDSITALAGPPKDTKKLKSGDILVEIDNKAHAEKLLRSTKFHNPETLQDIPIRVYPHKVLNYSKGVIRSSDIGMCDETEIKDRLRSQGVVNVQCLTRRTANAVVRSGTYFLTFNTPDLPEHITAGYLRIPVTPYIPNPLRCFNCQKLGHGQSKCNSNQVCSKCASPHHSFENCNSDEPSCVNCGGKHPSSYKQCPKWLEEKEIQKYKVENKCSFPEARQAIQNLHSGPSKSYAQAAKRTTTDSATQTDIGVQVSGEEIDAEVSKAPSSQKCIQCPHCQSNFPSSSVPKIIIPTPAKPINNVPTASAKQTHEPSPSTSSSSEHSVQREPVDSSSSANQSLPTSTPAILQQKTPTQTPMAQNISKKSNVHQPKPAANQNDRTPLTTSNRYTPLENEQSDTIVESQNSTQRETHEQQYQKVMSKAQRKKQKKKERTDLIENYKDKRPPKGAYNPIKEACLTEDEEEMEVTQTSYPPYSKPPISPISAPDNELY